jgi:hypothetical protein
MKIQLDKDLIEEDLIQAHALIVSEMESRDIKHEVKDSLDIAAREFQTDLRKDLNTTNAGRVLVQPDMKQKGGKKSTTKKGIDSDVLLVPGFISQADNGEEIVINLEKRSKSLESMLLKILDGDKTPCFVYNLAVPGSGYTPMFDLVIRRVESEGADPENGDEFLQTFSKDGPGEGEFNRFVKIAKVNKKKHIITGIVLEPDVEDLQGDTISPEEIENAAYKFMEFYGRIGFMHREFNKEFRIVETWLAPTDFIMGKRKVKKGSWLLSVKVLEPEIWKMVEKKEITGFSIGGEARAEESA